jgi:hypothetical protein
VLVDPLDQGSLGALPRERGEARHGLFISLEDGFDRAFRRVARPARYSLGLGESPERVAEEHTLNAPVNDEPAPDHADRLRALPHTTTSLVARLAEARIGMTVNFYRDGEKAGLRRRRLAAYLGSRGRAEIVLVGEAAGYRGARDSGVPFTSERQLSGSGPAEATATIVHRVLDELGLEEAVLLWNLVPTHPHRPGRPETNRAPTPAEIAAGRPFLAEVAGRRSLIAVGRLAERELGVPSVRHPSHGGGAVFRQGLIELLGV